jgi:hypothetical protein
MKAILVHNDEKYRKIQNDAKVAFMMAWHPRLGKNSLPYRCLTRDIAKIIIRMLSRLSPKYVKKILVFALPTVNLGEEFLMGVGESQECFSDDFRSHSICVVYKHFLSMSPVQFTCPLLDVVEIDKMLRYLVVRVDSQDNKDLIDYILAIEDCVLEGLSLTSFLGQSMSPQKLKESYVSSLERRKTTNDFFFKVNFESYVKIDFGTAREDYLKRQIENRKVKVGSKISFLIQHYKVKHNLVNKTLTNVWEISSANSFTRRF